MSLALLGLHAVLAAASPWLVARLGRWALAVCAIAPAATTVWALSNATAVVGRQQAVVETFSWVPSLDLTAAFRLDAFALVMVLLVSGIGTLIFLYAAAYFSAAQRDLGRFCAALVGFAAAMLGLVLSDNLILLAVFWELTSITSFVLIGFKDRDPVSRAAAVQALLTTGVGGLALLGGVVLIGQGAGSYSMAAVLASPPGGPTVTAGLVLVLLGAFTKSAQIPFHAWLPGAMAAPTPVSAYLHSATMVKAGVYVIARFAPAFALVPVWRPAVIMVGGLTMLVGAYRALRQHDLKLLLAYGTISQLGFMVVLFGIGTADATFAGVALLVAHGLFKAALFMVVGAIDVRTGTRDIRELHNLSRSMRGTFVIATAAVASMAGLPPLVGFIAKEAAYEGLLHGGFGPLMPATVAAIVTGSAITMAYSLRFLYGGFGPWRLATEAAISNPPSRRLLIAPAGLLSVLTVAAGLLPLVADSLVNAAATTLDPSWKGYKLALWHGVTPALLLSLVAVAVGAVAFALRDRVERWQARVPRVPSAKGGFDAAVRGIFEVARRVTGLSQSGSLPTYLLVILTTAVVLPGAALVTNGVGPPMPAVASNPAQLAICVIAVLAATATTLVARRFAAVLLLGAVGYSVAALFVLHGAPDLALTQMLVETLSLVIFVLVLRHLPSRFGSRAQPADRVLRLAVAGAVGCGVFVFSLVAAAARTAVPVSREYVQRAHPEAQGRNIVNVILVDFRAMDTLGEIVVLITAALGITSLILAGRLSRRTESLREDASP